LREEDLSDPAAHQIEKPSDSEISVVEDSAGKRFKFGLSFAPYPPLTTLLAFLLSGTLGPICSAFVTD
jgi:hypothetical protein